MDINKIDEENKKKILELKEFEEKHLRRLKKFHYIELIMLYSNLFFFVIGTNLINFFVILFIATSIIHDIKIKQQTIKNKIESLNRFL